jgi:membrane dipeptidase
MLGSPDARALLARYPAIDLHADTLMWARWTGYDVYARHTPPLPLAAFGGHIDLPRMLDGGMGAQFFGLVALPVTRRARGPARVIHEQIDVLDEAIVRRPHVIRIVKTAKELEACRADGGFAALLGIEGAHSLEGDLDLLGAFARRGVRYLGPKVFSTADSPVEALHGSSARAAASSISWRSAAKAEDFVPPARGGAWHRPRRTWWSTFCPRRHL